MNIRKTLLTITAITTLLTGLSATANSAASLNTDGLNPHVLQLALKGYQWALEHHQVGNKNVITVVDYTVPSYQQRMWVVDTHSKKVLMRLFVAHGKNSGQTMAVRFSNQPNSKESSLGVYTTAMNTNYGHDGLELRINGLEKGLNNEALARAVIIHGAAYVTPEFIKEHHRAGKSWGCFAVDPSQLKQLIHFVQGGSVIFAYAPQENNDPNLTTLS